MKNLVGLIILLSLGCTKVNFASKASNSAQQIPSPPPVLVSPPPPKCVGTIDQTTENLRIIFMVDNSGSTLTTDPSQSIRVQTLRNFIAKYGAKTNFTYAFGYFSDDAYVFSPATQKFIDVSVKSVPRSVFGTSRDLIQALSQFTQFDGFGGTSYGSAIDAVQTMISEDSTTTQWNYVLVFMSDGQPTDVDDPVILNLKTMIDSVTTAAISKGGLATTSMVLFDPINDSQYSFSAQNLSAMASEGKGQFFDTNFPPAGGLAIDDIISVPGQSCP